MTGLRLALISPNQAIIVILFLLTVIKSKKIIEFRVRFYVLEVLRSVMISYDTGYES